MIEAAVFDLDGLLIDSEPFWQQAEIEGFREVGASLSVEQAQETLGLRSDAVVELRFEQFGWNVERYPLADVEQGIIERVVELIRKRGRAKPGVYEALKFLERQGVRLALASSSRMVVIEAALAVLDIAERFAVVHSGEFEPLGKPHPGIYLTTATRLGIDPSLCVALEDSIPGLEAAKRAGMSCIAVPEPPAKGDPRLSEADLVLETLAELYAGTWARLEARV